MNKISNKNFNDGNIAIAYYRYSSTAQNDDSIEQQRLAAQGFAKSNGLTIIKEYEDRGISGTTEERPGYQSMLAELKTLKPNYLILWKTDRLGRDRYSLIWAKKKILDAHCKILLIAEPTPNDSPESALLEGLIEGLAEFYSRQLSVNVKRGMRYNAENCLSNGHRIFGYEIGPDKKYVINPDTAPVVQRIFHNYANGEPMQQIADTLNGQGIKTVNNKDFTINGLRSILRNNRYTGVYKYGDFEIEGGMPVIIEKTLFEQAQKMLKLNKRKKPTRKATSQGDELVIAPRFWLTEKLFCGYCKNTMQGISGTSGTGATYYYHSCAGKRKQKNGCKKTNIKKDLVEEIVIDFLKMLLGETSGAIDLAFEAADYHQKYYVESKFLEGLQKEKSNTESKLRNIIQAIEKGILTETTHSRLLELEKQVKDLTSAIIVEENKRQMTEDKYSIQAFFEKYKNPDFSDEEVRDFILDYLVDEIYVYDDYLEIKCWYSETRMKIEYSYADLLKEVGCIEQYEDVVENIKFVQLAASPTISQSISQHIR
jgi:DNA invertase Pin-like site-specific DNA recombinase